MLLAPEAALNLQPSPEAFLHFQNFSNELHSSLYFCLLYCFRGIFFTGSLKLVRPVCAFPICYLRCGQKRLHVVNARSSRRLLVCLCHRQTDGGGGGAGRSRGEDELTDQLLVFQGNNVPSCQSPNVPWREVSVFHWGFHCFYVCCQNQILSPISGISSTSLHRSSSSSDAADISDMSLWFFVPLINNKADQCLFDIG